MENLEDSSAALLSLPTSNGTEQQSTAPVANGSQQQQQVSLPATTPLLGTDQLTSPQLKQQQQAYVNPYPTSTSSAYPMNYNYQSYGQGSYGSTPQGYSSLGMNPYGTTASGTTPSSYPHSAYPQTTAQQGATSTTQPNATSPSLTHSYGAYPYSPSAASYAQNNYPISSQYAQTSGHMNSHVNYQPMQPQSTYQPPSGSNSLMTQMNNNQGMALPKATTPRAGPTKRRRASEDTAPKPVKPAPTVADNDNWERGQYQPTVRKRAKKSYGDDEDDDEDIDDDIEEDDDDMLQRTERKSLRERKPSKKGEKEKKSPSTSTATSPRLTPKKKETKVEEEEEVEEEQGNLEVELEFPEDSLLETDEETHIKKYSKLLFNGIPYVIGDTIAFWPEGKKGRPPMGTIKSFSTDGENNTVDCCWFYRVEETNLKGKRRQKIGPREVFLSEHTDPNACESIWKKVSIKSKYEVPDLEEYVKEADCYYYSSKFNHLELTFEDL
jgi:hypothetical protein